MKKNTSFTAESLALPAQLPGSGIVIDLYSTEPTAAACITGHLREAISHTPNAPIIVLVDDPVTLLARRLEHSPPQDAATTWAHHLRDLLDIQRKFRRQVTFVNADCLAHPNQQEKEKLAEKLKHKPLLPNVLSPTATPSKVAILCAASLIDTDEQIKVLAASIRAATIGGLRGPKVIDVCHDAWESWRQERNSHQQALMQSAKNEAEIASLKSRLDDKAKSVSQNLDSLAKLKQELEKLSTERDLLRETIALQNEALLTANTVETELAKQTSRLKIEQAEKSALSSAIYTKDQELLKLKSWLQHEIHKNEKAHLLTARNGISRWASWRISGWPNHEKGSHAAIRCNRPSIATPPGFVAIADWSEILLPGTAGSRQGPIIISKQLKGHVFYGPYALLKPGAFAADIILKLSTGLQADGYVIEVVSRGTVLETAALKLRRGRNRFLVPFYLPSSTPEHECEIRLFSPGNAIISLQNLTILAAPEPDERRATQLIDKGS
jgi:hypothetical protein